MERLDAVDDRDRWLQSLQLLKHQIKIGLRKELQITVATSKPLPAQLHLLSRLLSTDIQNRAMSSQRGSGLQQKGAFADPGVTTHEDQGTRHQAAPEHPVELLRPCAKPLQGQILQGGNGSGPPWCR